MARGLLIAAASALLLAGPVAAQPASPPAPVAPPAGPEQAPVLPPAGSVETPARTAPASGHNLPDPNDQSNTLTIGVGGAIIPDFEGSGDYRVIPAAAIRGRYDGVNFATRGTFLYVDFVPRGSGMVSFNAGPIAGVRLNRTGDIKDPAVDRLPELKTAIEVGGFAGVSLHGLTNPYDALTLRVDVVHDVAKAHRSTIVSPTLDFSTPLSRRTYVGLTAGLDFVADRYAQYYFGITPAASRASGLPVYSAGGGLKDWKVGLLVNQSITGDLLHGLSLFGTGSYSRLLGDFRRSPIVAQRGSASQWLGAVGLAYTF